MVDLPGQGKMPSRGLCFRPDMGRPVSAVLDWADAELGEARGRTAVYGVSGGGYFSALAVASDRRFDAWIASTPITDVAETFRREFGAALAAPGWIVKLGLRIAGALNESAELCLRKYAWQLGSSDFRTAVHSVHEQAVPVDGTRIRCPSLFLVGESEAQELKRQSQALRTIMESNGVNVHVHTLTDEEGAGSHCQVSNLRLAHDVIFEWLSGTLGA
jgi:hypothetical protein